MNQAIIKKLTNNILKSNFNKSSYWQKHLSDNSNFLNEFSHLNFGGYQKKTISNIFEDILIKIIFTNNIFQTQTYKRYKFIFDSINRYINSDTIRHIFTFEKLIKYVQPKTICIIGDGKLNAVLGAYLTYPLSKINIEETDLIQINKFFIKNNYCFVENLFDDNFYQLLKKNFPPKEFFPAPDNPFKNYRFNFRCKNNSNEYDSKKIEHLDLFSTLKKFYDFIINSKNFQKFIDTLTLDTGYKNYSVVSTLAFKNSYLIPHKDTVANSDDIKNIVNVIYFVDGADCPEFSGGTGIYKDNEFNNPIFLPSNLKNSALIYNSKSDFYHGFKPMKKNMFRKAVTAQFIKDYK